MEPGQNVTACDGPTGQELIIIHDVKGVFPPCPDCPHIPSAASVLIGPSFKGTPAQSCITRSVSTTAKTGHPGSWRAGLGATPALTRARFAGGSFGGRRSEHPDDADADAVSDGLRAPGAFSHSDLRRRGIHSRVY